MMENPKNRKWKVLTSEYLARKPWFTVRHESLEQPDGRRIPDYYVFEYPDWINVTAVTRDGRFVLIDQYRHGLGETSYEIPAGVTEPSDASPLDAAQRELMEETGYGGGQWRLLTTLSANPATQNNLTYCYLDKHYAMRRPEKSVKSASKPKQIYSGMEYLLVDGYNIIFSWDELKKAANESLDLARSMLVNRLCNYQGYKQCELILVFDAYKVKEQERVVENYHNISIVYTKEAETADTYIERTAHKLSREHKVRVATSDGMEQVIIMGSGAFRMSAQELHEDVIRVEKEIREYISNMK